MKTRQSTLKKYRAFIYDAASRKEPFKQSDIIPEHGVTALLFTAASELNYIVPQKGGHLWNKNKPVAEVVVAHIINHLNAMRRKYQEERKKKEAEKQVQTQHITEKQAIEVLKNSTQYTYEIYRVEKTML